MTNSTSTENVSESHISVIRRIETIRQVKLRIMLINNFAKEGIPEGFTEHLQQKTFLSYRNDAGIEPKSRPAVKKTNCLVGDIDESVEDETEKKREVNCLQYLEQKRLSLMESSTPDETHPYVESSNNRKSSSKTKSELKTIIKDNAQLIESLARELILQRQNHNKLINLLKERDIRYQNTLSKYYKKLQDDLYRTRGSNSVSLRALIDSLTEIVNEFENDNSSNDNKVVPLRGRNS